jgi:SAM-dependent methyltransferase
MVKRMASVSDHPLQRRYWRHYDRHPAAAYAAYFRYNGLRPGALRAFRAGWIRRAVELGMLTWPRQIAWDLRGRDVLDVGCGAGVEALGFRLVGAHSYVGVDERLAVDEDRVKNQHELVYQAFGATPREVALRLGGVELVRGTVADLPEGERFDVAVLHNVTEHLVDLEGVFQAIHRRLRKGGLLRFNHHNFYCWNGHHEEPKAVARIDPADERQKRFVDWNHLVFDDGKEKRYAGRLNRVRLDALRELTDRLFVIREWRELPIDERRGAGRLTAEIRARHAAYSVRELTTQAVHCRARKRAVPLPKLAALGPAGV